MNKLLCVACQNIALLKHCCLCMCVLFQARGTKPLKAVKMSNMWMCACNCVMACIQPDWSGNIVVCHGGAAAAATVDCGKTCWFRRGKKEKVFWGRRERKLKSNFLFPQQHPEKGYTCHKQPESLFS